MAKPKLALIPAAQGDKFYSVLPSNGVGDFDFTRNSSATRIAPTGFIQEVGAFGSELVTNGNFATDSDWLKATGWSISGGKAVATAANNGADLVQNIGLVNGKSYKIEVTISGYVAGSLRINFLGTGGNFGDFTANGTYIGYADGGSDSRLQITATTTTTTLSVDNVSVIEVIGNKSRLNYDLLNGKVVNCPHYLLEPARTNLLPYSNDFSNAAWSKNPSGTGLAPVVTPNSLISPDGTLNASKVVFNTGSGVSASDLSILEDTVTATSGISINQSVYLKGQNGGETILIRGANGSSYTTLTLTKEWVRYNFTETSGSTSSTWSIGLRQGLGGVVINSTATIYIYGAQFEAGTYPTSYIPTNGTAITRAAETANGSGDAATFNDSEGVLMFEASALADDGTYRIFSLSNSTEAERIYMQYTNVSNTVAAVVKTGSVTQANVSFVLPNETEFNKVSFKYKSNDFALWINGFQVATDTSGNTPVGLSELAFDKSTGSNDFYGKTREVQYFDSALTDAQLETLTSWTSLQEMITSQLYTNY